MNLQSDMPLLQEALGRLSAEAVACEFCGAATNPDSRCLGCARRICYRCDGVYGSDRGYCQECSRARTK